MAHMTASTVLCSDHPDASLPRQAHATMLTHWVMASFEARQYGFGQLGLFDLVLLRVLNTLFVYVGLYLLASLYLYLYI